MNFRPNGSWIVLAIVLVVCGLGTAQVNSNNLVTINLTTIKADIAKNINIDVSQVPIAVQAPVELAAAVCDVSPDTLNAQMQKADVQCTARRVNAALNDLVQKQVNAQPANVQPVPPPKP